MPKIKLPVKSPKIDMTPLVDLFSLLLTFFMLTSSFRPQEAAIIDTPSSVSEKVSPDKNIITILVDKDNKVFYNLDNGKDSSTSYRKDVLLSVGKQLNVNFTDAEATRFAKLSSFGMPILNMKKWINSKDSKESEKLQTGIPIDSTDNQLAMWVRFTRLSNPNAEVAIKGDGGSDFKTVKKIMDILQDNKVNKFNLTTNLVKEEATPAEIK
ncbi:MAG: biopolymer transporter ExbD [Bacteroidota bacterium]